MGKVIPSTWTELPVAIAERFGAQAGKQRAMLHEGHLVLVLHLVPRPQASERVAALFWRDPQGAWKSTGEAKGGLSGLRDLLEAYRKALAALETRVEEGTRAEDYFRVLQEVTPITRASRGLHRALQEARDAIKEDKDLIGARDAAADVERTAELLQADAQAAIDFTVARRAEEQAELAQRIAHSSHRLNLIAAFFLPLSALGSLFGVNLPTGLEGVPVLFWLFVAAAVGLGYWVRSSVVRAGSA